MGRYTGPKVKKSKRVRAPIAETTKHMKADLDRGPGQHGMSRRRKTTLFGERLREKQKLCFFYHVSDKQFRRLMAEAARTPAGPKRAPGRLVVARSRGTPVTATSMPVRSRL